MSSTTAGANLLGYNLAGNKSIVIVAHTVSLIPSGNFVLTYPGTTEPAQWQSQWAGSLLSLNVTMNSLAGSGNVKVAVANNNAITTLATSALNFTGSRQVTNVVPTNTVAFSPGDTLTLVGIPSGALTIALTVTATLMVII